MVKSKIFVAIVAIWGMSGCGYMGFKYANIKVQPSKCVNVDENCESLPTVIRIYQLKTDHKMKDAAFIPVWNSAENVLGDSLIANQGEFKEIIIYPGANKEIKIDKEENANFIAIVASLRKAGKNEWKQIIKTTKWTIGGQSVDIVLGKDNIKIGVLDKEKQDSKCCKTE